MRIEILGSGCAKCKQLTANVETAVKELGLSVEVFKIIEIAKIISYGVMLTPALVIDGKVKSSGRSLSVAEIKKIIL
ncbi:MAG: thioredoxin family protein [Candidatus Omnitrophica bacterium]|nr:thioredoxin family protein [Candidatus Omnitrophota bacterium]